jgi:hypothetical protein
MAKNSLSNKKGLSTIVITVILIAISMGAVVLVWSFANNLIKKQIGNSESCFGNYDKVTLNKQYTCYDSATKTFRFSLSIGNIEVDKVIVSVSSASAIKSYELTNEDTAIAGLANYPGGTTTIKLPTKNSGTTYSASGFDSVIDLIKIAPVINGAQCEVSDTLSQIEDCSLLQ